MERDDAGRLIRVVDRGGRVHAELVWKQGELAQLDVPGLTLHGAVVDDELLGPAHVIECGDVRTAMSRLQPDRIPTIAAPGKLPPGAGGALMNAIALLGDEPRRYAGPYPTPALFRSLQRSFRTAAREEEFSMNLLDRAARLATDVLPFDFVPAPHERIAFGRGHVELRDTLERAVIGGLVYERGIHRLVDGHAEIWFADAPYARVASFTSDGALVDGPHAVPACTSSVIGKAFPAELAVALAELIADYAPSPIGDLVATRVANAQLGFADLGARAARETDAGFELHAALWDRLSSDLPRLAAALVEALVPVATASVLSGI